MLLGLIGQGGGRAGVIVVAHGGEVGWMRVGADISGRWHWDWVREGTGSWWSNVGSGPMG